MHSWVVVECLPRTGSSVSLQFLNKGMTKKTYTRQRWCEPRELRFLESIEESKGKQKGNQFLFPCQARVE